MFDYEGDLHRASRPQASKQEYTPPRQAASSAAPAGAQRPRAMAAAGVGNAQMHHDTKVRGERREEKRSFQVNIDDSEFYDLTPEPQYSYGGGNNDNHDRDGEAAAGRGSGGGSGRWAKAILVLVIVLGVSIFLAFFALQSASDMFGLNKQDSQVEIELPENQSIPEIAKLLKENGVIQQSFTFQVYAGLKNKAENLVPGTYVLNSNMSYEEILAAFRIGNTKKVEVQITFYEGMTLSEIADRLEENKVVSREEFLDYLENGDMDFGYDFLSQIPDNDLRYHKYEGYIFPDTYLFYEGESVSRVVQKFLKAFNDRVTDEMFAEMEKMGMTLDETITLASMIQKEAGNVADMSPVSGVFHNRLKNPDSFPQLQSDVTIFYVEDDIKPYISVADQEMYDAYNTYVCQGLPVGPICSPGVAAIEAALNPQESNYFFFVTDEEGNYYYAETAQQHDINVLEASKKGKTHGIDTATE